ncbi:MAG: glycosyltransferase family 39 protein [Chloroflexi bacterium]|nr:glycosyltransferase family 39 protein [Chloroflexota bacterium]
MDTSLEVKSVAVREQKTRSAWGAWVPLLGIWLIGLVVRLMLTQGQRVVWGDEPFYLWLGRNWITGQGFTFTGHADVHHGPLFPMAAGLLYLLTGDMILSSDILYIVFGSLLVLPVYGLGCELYERRVALAAAGLTAVFPALGAAILYWGTLTEPLYMFFVYSGLWAGAVALRPIWRTKAGEAAKGWSAGPWWAYLLAGLAFGLAYLTRPEAIGYFAVAGVVFVLFRLLRRTLPHRWRVSFFAKLLLFVLAFALAFVPYAYYVYLNTGSWMVSEKVGVTYLTCIGMVSGDVTAFDKATWGLDSTGLETFFFSPESYNISMLQLVLDDPQTFLNVLYMNARNFVQLLIDPTLFPYALLVIVFLGLFRQAWTRSRTFKELYLVSSFAPVAAFILIFVQARYLVAMIPVMILWLACGLVTFSDWLIDTVERLRESDGAEGEGASQPPRQLAAHWRTVLNVLPALLVMLGLAAMQPVVVHQMTNVGWMRIEHRLVGEYLQPTVSRDTVIMARYPAIAFHADTQWVPTPSASWAETLRYARHKGVDYFVLDEREVDIRPQFLDMVSGQNVPPELELFYQIDSGGARMLVYRLREAQG